MKVIKKLLFALLIFLFWGNPVHAQDIKVTFNGEALKFDAAPIMENDRVLIPVRQLSEMAGAQVEYLHDKREVIIKKDEITITLRLDNKTALVNERIVDLTAAPKIVNDRTFVPLRFISEYFGFDVSWNQTEMKVSIAEKPQTEQILWNTYLKRYHAPFSPYSQYSPSFNFPFSFSGTIDLNLQQGQQTHKLNITRNGSLSNGRFIFSTNGTGQDDSIQTIHDEFYQDLAKPKAYRNQGNGWSRFRMLDYLELDERSWYQHQLLAFLLLNCKDVNMDDVESNGRKLYRITSNITTDDVKQMDPLVEVLESNFKGIFEDYGKRNLEATVTILLDAESLRMHSSEMNFKYVTDSKTASYTAAFTYQYNDINVIDDIVIQNTGLESINDVIENERFVSYGLVGEIGGYQVKGSVLKDGQRYIKVSQRENPILELYENWPKQIKMYRYSDQDDWTSSYGWDTIRYLIGNKGQILNVLNSQMAVPKIESVNKGGRQKQVFTFNVSANHWQDADQLLKIVKDDGIIGYSFDTKADATFVFEIDVQTKFIDSLSTEITVTDDDETETISCNFAYFLDQVEAMPEIPTK